LALPPVLLAEGALPAQYLDVANSPKTLLQRLKAGSGKLLAVRSHLLDPRMDNPEHRVGKRPQEQYREHRGQRSCREKNDKYPYDHHPLRAHHQHGAEYVANEDPETVVAVADHLGGVPAQVKFVRHGKIAAQQRGRPPGTRPVDHAALPVRLRHHDARAHEEKEPDEARYYQK